MADAMKRVPCEPTEEMIEAGNKALFRDFGIRAGKGPLHTLFAAMLAASPPAREEAPAEGAGELDGTDAAHPAWWRGHEQTTQVLCQKIVAILDGEDSGSGVANDPWESVRRRLIALRNRTSEPEAGEVAKPAPFNLGGIGHSMFAAFHAFRDEYVLSTEGLDYTPSEFERSLIEDFFCGLMSEEAFFGPIRRLYDAPAPAPATADKLRVAVEALEPFAEVTGIKEWPDEEKVCLTCDGNGLDFIRLGAFRRAAQALAALNEQPQ